MTGLRDDTGDIVLSWLTKTVVIIAIFGLVLFDAIAVAVGRMNTTDAAGEVALAGSEAWHLHPDVQTAYNAAEAAAESRGGEVLPSDFTVDTSGTVRLRLRRQVTTLLMHRVGPLRRFTVAVESGQANSVP